jgi:hypothetical protein
MMRVQPGVELSPRHHRNRLSTQLRRRSKPLATFTRLIN